MSRAPIVLVHGAWAGAWAWRRVLAPLRAAGHEVHAVTLTGCGERAHLLRPDISVQTHIADVLGLVDAEDLQDLVLVGHSYAGLVITGAAHALRVRDQGRARLRQLVYVDAMVPLSGECWSSRHSEAVRAERSAAAAATGLNALPAPDPSVFGLSGADRDWLARRQCPHPFGPYRDVLPLGAEALDPLPRAFIDCTTPAYPTIAPMRERVRALAGFQVVTMPTGHYPQIERPEAFVQVLLRLMQ